MKALILMLSAVVAAPAFADGFVCENMQEHVRVKVYNQTSADRGTRNSAVMVVSDPSVSAGRKTIATFEAADGLLTNVGSRYTAHVDLRYKNSNRSGENLASTKLGNVDEMIVDVDFSYAQPVEDESELSGQLILKLRNGEVRTIDMQCERYLKN